jgi:hypothetical protein
MAQFWVPGPVELHAGVGVGGALAFVGWADVGGFHVRIVPAWGDMRADVKGNAVDVQRMGEEAFITGELKIWNEDVLRRCQSRGNPQGGVPGVMTANEMGMPMILGGATIPSGSSVCWLAAWRGSRWQRSCARHAAPSRHWLRRQWRNCCRRRAWPSASSPFKRTGRVPRRRHNCGCLPSSSGGVLP